MKEVLKETFIDEEKINSLLEEKKDPSNEDVRKILKKALKLKGLELDEVATLLNVKDESVLEELYHTALTIKELIYGNRLVLFAPLYTSNYCSNNCLYCGFRLDNKEMDRISLSLDEIKDEVRLILEQGHKRILMLMGEYPTKHSFDFFLEAIEAVYTVKDSFGNSIRRINVEIPPLTDEEFQKISKVPIGTYTVFQETYHRETYRIMHPTGKKADFPWRLYVMDRALKNGLHDVGIGALFGLYDYRFEVMGLLSHAKHLDETYGVGPHTISIPRIEFAQNAPVTMNIPYPVSDMEFKKLVAIIRCAVPYTGMIISTRESAEMREHLFNMGVSQVSAGSKTNPGGYKEAEDNVLKESQFTVHDTRTTKEIITSVIKDGFIPSFCTACYRTGRVGQDFMDLAKPGLIKLNCLPNALLTLKEYLEDYADEEIKSLGEALIEKELKNIPTEDRKKTTIEYLDRIAKGERDLIF